MANSTHLSQMDLPALISRKISFQILEVLGGIFYYLFLTILTEQAVSKE